MSIPNLMKGVLIEEPGAVDALQYKIDIPDGEVLIKNDFAGINHIDITFRTGLYPAPKPQILGCEAEGTIVSVSSTGETYGLKPGDRVVWIAFSGGYAEYTTCPASKVYVLPSGLEPGVAAASISQGLTALPFIRKAYHVQKGDWIMVQGAAGGVGQWLCQLLRSVGARIFGTASTAEKIKLAIERGAEFALNYSQDDIVARVMDITNGEGVAAVFDSIGASTFEANLQMLARNGTMVSYGNASGSVPPFNINALSSKNLRLMRPSVFGYVQTRDEFVGFAEKLFQFIVDNKLDGMVYKVYPLSKVAKAHADLEGRKTTGKLLLKV